jgi:hypothetical protein
MTALRNWLTWYIAVPILARLIEFCDRDRASLPSPNIQTEEAA